MDLLPPSVPLPLSLPMVSPDSIAYGLFLGAGAVVLAMGLFFLYLAIRSRKVVFLVDEQGLRIEAVFYGRTIPKETLDLDAARIIDVGEHPELKLKRRSNGMGLPGLKTGWYKKKDGSKLLVFVTDQKQTLHIPTRKDYELLLNPTDPQALLSALRR